jgi:cytochrome c oxidase assembly protein subunit 15
MVDWKLIQGTLPPLNEAQWQETFEKYKSFPQYKLINKDMSLDGFKKIFFWEYIHRVWGRLIGIIFIIPWLYFILKKQLSVKAIKHTTILLLLGGLQGFIGWFMVKSGLVNIPSVSHYRLALHLSTALFLLSYIYWLYLVSGKNINWSVNNRHIFNFGILMFIILCIQIIYGAFMSGLKAGFAAPTFPLINESIIPAIAFKLEPLYMNLINNKIMIQFIHRTIGFILLIMGCYLGFILIREKTKQTIRLGGSIILIVCTQVLLGVITLLSFKNGMPITLASLHQFAAILLMLCILHIIIKSKNKKPLLSNNKVFDRPSE